MGRITMPTLLIGAGPTSPIPQGQVTAFAGPLPDVRLATVGGGHPVHETRPKEFLAAMEAFLAA
ncbi:alpha/beta fold hydrolase [Streptomyces sp. MMG1533]|uniref:alpha/beta fold hydrolase n=1 Tax=Streptomyces sp. MMG1533 TaxID=1415546 RepID=UPI001F3D4E47|nr:alpha/beta hydrolase [Streptomyces sp. MMG1533]